MQKTRIHIQEVSPHKQQANNRARRIFVPPQLVLSKKREVNSTRLPSCREKHLFNKGGFLQTPSVHQPQMTALYQLLNFIVLTKK